MFTCDACGTCCTKLHKNALYKNLDRGDGVCIHFNKNTNLCEIYETRPIICRVDEMYWLYYYKYLDIGAYYSLNYESCRIIQSELNPSQKYGHN